MNKNESYPISSVTPGPCDELSRALPHSAASPFSPEMIAALKEHFWCDFSDIIPSMAWDDPQAKA